MNKQLWIISGAVAALALAAGCGGGTSQSTLPSHQLTSSGPVSAEGSVKMTIPRSSGTASTDRRSPEYISTNTNSFSVQVGTGVPVVTDVDDSTDCSGSPITCTVSFTGVVGQNELTVKTYQSTDGTGPSLSQNTILVTLTSGDNSAVDMTLDGVATTIGVVLDPTSVTIGTPNDSIAAEVEAFDASDEMIMGQPVDSKGDVLGQGSYIPTLTSSDTTDFSVGSFSADSGGFTVSYNGASTTSPVTFTLALTGFTSATADLTVNAATPTPSPSASPENLLSNGNFDTGDLTGWYRCYAGHGALAASVDPNPAPSTEPEPTQSPPGTTIGQTIQNPQYDMGVASTVPYGSMNDGSTYAAQVGQVGPTPFPLPSADGRDKGLVGICQDVAIPADPAADPELTLWVYEGGNASNISSFDAEADIIPASSSPGWVTGTGTGAASMKTTDPFKTGTPLFAEANCYNNLNISGGALSAGPCATPDPATPLSGAPGGQWREKGPYDLSAYDGQTVTLLLGVWSSSTSAGYYDYAYFDQVVLLP